jgi:hypothetical protein
MNLRTTSVGKRRVVPGVLFAGMLMGCEAPEKVTFQDTGNMSLVSATAGNAVSVVRVNGDARTICPRLGPDTASDRSASFGGSIGLINGDSGGTSEGQSDVEVELAGRTPSIILTRDTLFQVCVMYQNGFLTREEFLHMTMKYLDAGYALAKVEAANTQIQIGEAAQSGPVIVTGVSASSTPAQAPGPAPAPAPSAAKPL